MCTFQYLMRHFSNSFIKIQQILLPIDSTCCWHFINPHLRLLILSNPQPSVTSTYSSVRSGSNNIQTFYFESNKLTSHLNFQSLKCLCISIFPVLSSNGSMFLSPTFCCSDSWLTGQKKPTPTTIATIETYISKRLTSTLLDWFQYRMSSSSHTWRLAWTQCSVLNVTDRWHQIL